MKTTLFRTVLILMMLASSLVALAPANAWHGDPCYDTEYPYTPKDFVFTYSIMASDCNLGDQIGDLTLSGWVRRDVEHSFPASAPTETYGSITCQQGHNCQLTLTLPHPPIETGIYEVEVWGEGTVRNQSGELWRSWAWSYGGCISAVRYTMCDGNAAWLPPPSCEYVEKAILNLCKDWPLLEE